METPIYTEEWEESTACAIQQIFVDECWASIYYRQLICIIIQIYVVVGSNKNINNKPSGVHNINVGHYIFMEIVCAHVYPFK
jgi:hypothetical protein